ncbi:MAG: superoxide dismutase [Candidatus Babeliaceae bacterium]|nr:superoxide dismutase [Candidatus Babeliaceae bacterium]
MHFFIVLTFYYIYPNQHYPFSLDPLGYSFNALEPYIDATTMEVHYTGHHDGYVKNLNDALKDYPELQHYTLGQLLTMLDKIPGIIRTTVQNNAGGHQNHTFFWRCMTPKMNKPSNKFLKTIKKHFRSFENFKNQFNEAAKKIFGSGWAWLCFDPGKNRLVIISTSNQNSPITDLLIPLLGLDVWEHAYYLKHKNKRASYIDAWWNVVDWSFVEENYIKAASIKSKA